jgi:hypothetical protein
MSIARTAVLVECIGAISSPLALVQVSARLQGGAYGEHRPLPFQRAHRSVQPFTNHSALQCRFHVDFATWSSRRVPDDRRSARLASTDRPRCNGGSYLGPTETMILMSELPRIPFNMPDTWIVKESCPTKSELAVYENPGPSNFTWPDCGGEMSFVVSMVTRAWRRPRVQLCPLLVCMVQSTVSDFS